MGLGWGWREVVGNSFGCYMVKCFGVKVWKGTGVYIYSKAVRISLARGILGVLLVFRNKELILYAIKWKNPTR